MKTHLFLFTNEYPCSKTLEHYIGHEINFLSREFEKVIIVPSTFGKIQKQVPDNVLVLDLYQPKWFKSSFINKVKALIIFLCVYPGEMKTKGFLPAVKRMGNAFKSFYNAFVSGEAVMNYLRENNIRTEQCVFYSYWFYHSALTLGILKWRKKISAFFSRAHLADLYTEQFPEYDLFHYFKAKQVSTLFPISTHAKNYLDQKYPALKNKFVVSRLAVSDMGLNPQPDSEVCVVSCSTYSDRKRVDLLTQLIADFSLPVKWIHFGYVPPDVIEGYRSRYNFSGNIKSAQFKGDVPNEEVMNFYKKHPVTAIINLSTSEGLPFSLIEATSFGIPVLATDVNGTPDVATPLNGHLLPVNFAAEQFNKALEDIICSGNKFREGARTVYTTSFKAEINYPEFISVIKQ